MRITTRIALLLGLLFSTLFAAQAPGVLATGTSNVAIVTTENGQSAYDACYVLVDFSNVGCDENGDGDVTFRDIPPGTYTVRQTADLGPGRYVEDTTITVTGAASSDGWERFSMTILSTSGGSSTASGVTGEVAIFTYENGGSATDVCYVLVNYSNVGCDENRDGRVMFADIPWGTYTVRQTADLGPGRHVDDFTIEVRGNVSSAGWEGFSTTVRNTPVSSSTAGSVDISLITRDPDTGGLLTGTCYVLVDYSNEGCDENRDGQVTFADIPFGTYTVHQTQTPAGYPTINDYDINVDPVQGMPGETFVGPLGFIVKQAPEQNAPNTRNVSIVLVDYDTNQKIVSDACVEIIGASNIGCDEDLRDGQIDFLDVPAGFYEFTFTQFPDGYTGAPFMNTSWLEIDPDSYDQPANVMIYVWLVEADGAGSVMIEPAHSSSSSGSQSLASTSGVTEATVLMTFRGCPEGFVPDVDDPFTACTVPLDAPDASLVGEWGVGQSLVPITGLEREYDGSYVFHVSSDGGYYLELTGMEPVLRDDFLIYGVDDQDRLSYVTLLDHGETREIFVFYYYE